jgi:excisionase family DNA binding protein
MPENLSGYRCQALSALPEGVAESSIATLHATLLSRATLDDAPIGANMSKQNIENVTLEPAYSVSQLVSHYHNSESFWRKEMGKGRLRYYKLGSSVRIPKSALDEYFAKRESE